MNTITQIEYHVDRTGQHVLLQVIEIGYEVYQLQTLIDGELLLDRLFTGAGPRAAVHLSELMSQMFEQQLTDVRELTNGKTVYDER